MEEREIVSCCQNLVQRQRLQKKEDLDAVFELLAPRFLIIATKDKKLNKAGLRYLVLAY